MILISLLLFFLAIVIHEYAHGWVAYKLGDPTAKNAGRLTLNPLAHIDPMGTIFLPLMLIFMGSPIIFGWAKPVPINFSLLRQPKRDMLWVSTAGIAANILLAFVLSFLLRMGLFPVNSYGWLILNYGILINLVLAVFNAVPIPPLDGSRILMGLIPRELAYSYARLERFGFLILIGLLWLGLLNRVIWPVVMYCARTLGASL
ncbi:MAG: site-2 protease family protein [Candidatus Omnitrophica bacterium]|nr:site-2 protease family protein [Candidatus Omnitrophota bacterium]